MRKLSYSIDLAHFEKIKADLVPAMFTKHQFELIRKKFSERHMTATERNEFSRAVSRKMKAINKIMDKETGNVFAYGSENIRTDRLKLITSSLRRFSRKFKNRHIFITGSFLYKEKYNDIDIFVVSKYDKDDYHDKEFHINYVDEEIYSSLFFASARRLCISNRRITTENIKGKPELDIFISLYQELFNEVDRKFKGVRSTLREFLVYAAFIAGSPIPNSLELSRQSDKMMVSRKPKELIKKIFVQSIILGTEPKEAAKAMKEMMSSYKDIMNEYRQHREYYLDLVEAFKEVISFESL